MSANMALVHLALRTRAFATTISTTGTMILSATVTGYARTTGSFITDGFAVGQEVVPSGFGPNVVGVITAVTALTLSVTPNGGSKAAAAGRALVVGVPTIRGTENVIVSPMSGRPYIVEEFEPAGGVLRAGPAANGVREETGLYHLRWYGLANTGMLGIRQAVQALEARFTPGTTLPAGADTVRIRGDVAPFVSRIAPRDDNWAVCVLSIPWRVFSTNVII